MSGRTAAPGGARLGVIWPDDGRGDLDYEALRLGPWFAAQGYGQVEVLVERSVAGRSHVRADLLQTGDDDALAPPADRLAAAGAGAIIWACTSGSFIGGLAWAKAQAASLAQRTRLPATSATLALIDAVHALGADRVDLLSAYPQEITRAFIDCLRYAGIATDRSIALGCPDGTVSFRVDLMSNVAAFAGRSNPLVIPDTAINTLELLPSLEAAAGRPVLSANQALVWRALALFGLAGDVPGAGALFARSRAAHPPAA